MDGAEQLRQVLAKAGFGSIPAAVASHTVFLHPDSVAQAGHGAVYPVARMPNLTERGGVEMMGGRRVMLDDNHVARVLFLRAAGWREPVRDVQIHHVWGRTRDPDAFTALWNMCATPAFLARTADAHPAVADMLRLRSFILFGCVPPGAAVPVFAEEYDTIVWAQPAPRLDDLESTLRESLTGRRSRTARVCRDIGWVFSGWEPDTRI